MLFFGVAVSVEFVAAIPAAAAEAAAAIVGSSKAFIGGKELLRNCDETDGRIDFAPLLLAEAEDDALDLGRGAP